MATMNGHTVPAHSALKTQLTEFAHRRSNEGPYADNLDVDVLIVGAGFGRAEHPHLRNTRSILTCAPGGTYLLYELRKAGYKTVVYDAGTSFGGTWRWNIYRLTPKLFPRSGQC